MFTLTEVDGFSYLMSNSIREAEHPKKRSNNELAADDLQEENFLSSICILNFTLFHYWKLHSSLLVGDK